MWHNTPHLSSIHSTTSRVTMPATGIVEVELPHNIELSAYVNDVPTSLHHLHVNEGDSLYFKLDSNSLSIPSSIHLKYNGEVHSLSVLPDPEHKDNPKHQLKEKKMIREDINVFGALPAYAGSGGMGAAGAGLGAGVLGGVLGGALLNNRNGLFGNNNDGVVGNFVTPTQLQTGLDAVTSQNQNTTILQSLGDIKAAIPLAESQVQLALAGAQNDINAQINSSTANILNNQTGIARDIANSTATILASQNSVEDTVQNGIASVNLGIANLATQGLQNTYSLANVIRDDGDKTRALITSFNDANLQRQLATAEAALLEQRAIGRSREVEVNVTQNVNQNQVQMQQQAQFQTLANALSTLIAQNQHIGQSVVNLGTMSGSAGSNTAANTRVNS